MPYVNKVVFGSETLINLENDTITADKVLSGYTFHDKSGAPATGSCLFNANTAGDSIDVNTVLQGVTFHNASGSAQVGTMPNIGTQTGYIVSRDSAVAIQAGYHDGSGTIALGTNDKTALISNNIREGVTILGITGSMSGSEDVKATSLAATPYTTSKVYHPNDLGDYNYFSQVTVDAIAYGTVLNAAGGLTATIGTVAPA